MTNGQATCGQNKDRAVKRDGKGALVWIARSANTFCGLAARRRAPAGFMLIEAVLVLTIFGIVMSISTSYLTNAYRIFSGVRAASQLRYANDVIQEFVLLNADEIKNQLSSNPKGQSLKINYGGIDRQIPIKAHRQRHDIVWKVEYDTLKAIAELYRGAPPHLQVEARIVLSPRDGILNNCKTPDKSIKNCAIETVVYRNQPVRHKSQPDWVALNAGLRSLKAGGGLSLMHAPDTIRFHSHDQPTALSENPAGSKPGILAIRGEQAPHHRPFLDLRYGQMFGAIDMGGNAIRDAQQLTVNKVKLTLPKSTVPTATSHNPFFLKPTPTALPLSRKLSFADSDQRSNLAFTSSGISTGDWKWQFQEITIAETRADNTHRKSEEPNSPRTRFKDGNVVTNEASVGMATTWGLFITDMVTASRCDADGTMAFDVNGLPIYCRFNRWTPFE